MTTAALRKTQSQRRIARPLKVLVPLIKDELDAGDDAGLEHYRRAGEMLLEAREQLSGNSWTQWLTRNFELSKATAFRYMQLAKLPESQSRGAATIEGALGVRSRRERHAVWGKIRDVADRVNVTRLADAEQSREQEIKLRRDLALQLIDLGYRALATRLHPDRGGSKDAMARLNFIRDELKSVAETRRFI